jgi:hypothetical protein
MLRLFVIALGFEPRTACLEGRCSIQLSYATILKSKTLKNSIKVGVAGFEPAASTSQTWRDNRATLHPELIIFKITYSRISCSKFAERQGFEPWVSVSTDDDLANRSFRPLRHLSNIYKNIPLNADANVTQHFKERNIFFEFFQKKTSIFYIIYLSVYLSGK